MRIAAVTAEYDPFHAGHAYHLRRVHESADAVVIIMSGEFTQRGLPAITDKWTRTKMALIGGADIVIELPVLYATMSAEGFAEGSVRLINALGIDLISFGAETADMALLRKAAHLALSEPPEFKEALKKGLARGHSYAHARREAVATAYPDIGHIFSMPNNLLGIEYLKAIERLCTPIDVLAVQRIGTGHNDTHTIQGIHPSSTSVRTLLRQDPERDASFFEECGIPMPFQPVPWEKAYFLLVAARLRSMIRENLAQLPGCEKGLDWRVWKAARRATSLRTLTDSIASRRYPYARVHRFLLHALLGVTKEDHGRACAVDAPIYAHVLGFRKDRSNVLSELTHRSVIPISSRFGDLPEGLVRHFDEKATDIYGLLMNPVRRAGADWFSRVVTL